MVTGIAVSKVTWCFTHSQPLRLCQGEWFQMLRMKRRECRNHVGGWGGGGGGEGGGGGGLCLCYSLRGIKRI